MNRVLDLINQERKRQDEKFGVQSHSMMKWMVILMEEVGEASEAILKQERENIEAELVQVAAVAVAALENLKCY